ncbi:hypothetical protein ACFC0D_30155 [Streptomyces sp. NPDC056222]|uniref:hypothetical protein n=1 Tax=Streptomyces sp. NPDC056222 TaxID=3345749 RepID=UPI0035D887D3
MSDDPETESELDRTELAFVAALRERAEAWKVPPAVSWAGRPEDDSSLVMCMGLGDGPLGWPLRIGLHLTGPTVSGDRLVHQDFYWLPQPRTGLALGATGTPHALAAPAADWFERILRMPGWCGTSGITTAGSTPTDVSSRTTATIGATDTTTVWPRQGSVST